MVQWSDKRSWSQESQFNYCLGQNFFKNPKRTGFAIKVNQQSFGLFISHQMHFTNSQGLLNAIVIRTIQSCYWVSKSDCKQCINLLDKRCHIWSMRQKGVLVKYDKYGTLSVHFQVLNFLLQLLKYTFIIVTAWARYGPNTISIFYCC